MSLLEIKNLSTIAADDHEKHILKGLNLTINKGEIHVIMGPNGSGKTTLANTIFKLNGLKTDEIARKGIFMSFQIPEEVPGISVAQFIKTAKKSLTNEKVNIFTLSKEVEENMKKLDMNTTYTNGDLNVGFSGGEKKKNEILQLLTFNPKLAILDETDSGLDVDAIKTVSKGIDLYKNDDNAVLIITHSTKILKSLKVDYVHILVDGKIVLSGDSTLAKEIEENGYTNYIK